MIKFRGFIGFIFLTTYHLLLATYCSGGVVINEFVYDADGTDSGYEWIELYNNLSNDVSITGWKIQKWSSSSQDFEDFIRISSGTYTIAAKSYFLLSQSVNFDKYSADFKYSDDDEMGNSSPQCIRLVDSFGNEMDRVAYEDTYATIVPGEGNTSAGEAASGSSLTRDPDGADTDDNAADFYENVFPTPRSSTYGSFREEGFCYAAPNPFIPAEDGTCKIIAPASCGALSATIEIYDLSGMLVKKLTGTNVWDGTNEECGKVATGNYFIIYRALKGVSKGKMTIIR
ncbi:MAG: lamin tail domain-containing protein [Elusimicrobia bacterium]|nr:lamin tail domain-containing protein [Elusimicrobiota bacterium]